MTTTPPNNTNAENAVSKVEKAKLISNHLRGTIASTLHDPERTHFDEDDLIALKFHGIYQQDDRDQRIARRKQGLDKDYSFMIRICVPGGVCTAQQYLDIDALARRHAEHGIRLTTRQAFQLHGVIKTDLHDTMRRINRTLLTSLAACGDIPRNVMAPPAPFGDPAYDEARALAGRLARELAPATNAYHEIWIDGERLLDTSEEEPFYGDAYLPRKFKLGVALEHDNSVDAYAYDAALIGIIGDDHIIGYNLVVGGGFGMTHNKPDTIARVATPIAFVTPGRAVEAMRAVVAVYRDHGNRESRRHARVKYLVEEWGGERLKTAIEQHIGETLDPPRTLGRPKQLDHLGVHEQGDGRLFLGVFVPNGRVTDTAEARYASAFRLITQQLAPRVILTPMQSIIFADLTPDALEKARQILAEHAVPEVDALSPLRRYAMACPALPTCGLALTESERAQPALIDALEHEFDRLAIADADITVRMTGCPNGCARPYNADIGVVGRKPGVYHIFVGGGLTGDRLADLFEPDVPFHDIVPRLRPLLERYANERLSREPLGDFYRRAIATDRPQRTLITGAEEPTAKRYSLSILP
ncbi:MAG: NADPH-dependent assimilatory sulfite reductase hemoprotein subunit [Phycisphaerales bacterium]